MLRAESTLGRLTHLKTFEFIEELSSEVAPTVQLEVQTLLFPGKECSLGRGHRA